jgi:two-component system NtrC family response regulator
VRELANVVEHATILCDSGPIRREHLPQRFDSRQLIGPARQRPGVMTLRELEMEAIHDALERTGGNKPKAADQLGISLKTLYNKLNQTGTLEKSA